MDDERVVGQLEPLDDRRDGISRCFQCDFAPGGALAGSRGVEADAPVVRAETRHDVPPDERPRSGVDEEERRALPDVGHGDVSAVEGEVGRVEGPHLLGEPG
ncbi:MAG TPA: hypothetical protein VE404_11055, partial [Verrucomicrobiae bacterium]|nr:hypothetical protein [Verrucomicrobiae bacterium]